MRAFVRIRKDRYPGWAGLVLLSSLILTSFPAESQTIQWTRQFGTNAEDQATGIAVDSTGVYVVGYTWGSLPGQTNSGLADAYVRKYDRSGNEVWTRQFGGGSSGQERALGAAADSTGIFVVGYTTGTLPGQTHGGGVLDVFVRKYDANGTEQWTRQFSSNVGNEEAHGAAVDSTGVYVVGFTNGALPGQTLGSTGVDDSFIRKYSLTGTELWTRQFGTPSGEEAYGVAVDSSGVYVAGATNGLLAGTERFGAFDAFLRKYDANGTVQWTRQFGTTAGDYAWAVAAGGGAVYVAGRTDGALPGQTSASPGVKDAFVRKYDANGSELWTRQFGTIGQDEAFGVAADASGVSVVGTANFALPGLPANTVGHGFFRKYNANGTEQLTEQFGSGGADVPLGVALDANGAYVAGHTNGRFPGQTFLGSSDGFVLAVPAPAGEISLIPRSFRFSGSLGGPVQRQVLEIRSSGGTVAWLATARVLNGTGWLVTSPPSGTVAPNLSSTVTLDVNFGAFSTPGTYQAVITISQSDGAVLGQVPVTVVVSPAGSSLLLSQTSFLFRTVEGRTAPSQELRILNAGQGSMAWSIQSRSNQVTLSSSSGTESAGTRGASTTLSVNAAGLAPGVYQDLLTVSAPGAANNPQVVTATLLVSPASTPAKPEFSAHGILIAITQSSLEIPSIDFRISNAGGGSASFQLQTTTESGGNWLAVTSPGGTLGTQAATVTVTPSLVALTPGVYRGRITATFTPGGTREVDVLLVFADVPVIPFRDAPRPAACAPHSMDMLVTSVGNGSALSVSFPRTLQVQVVDSCGNLLDNATVVATVEGNPIALQTIGEGFYTGTWAPGSATASTTIAIAALHPTYARVDRSVTVSTQSEGGAALPVLFPDGVVEGAAFTPRRPLAPGGIISLFGSAFAAADAASVSLPLATSLGGVSVEIGGAAVPLYFAGPGQINAQVPYSVQPGNNVPVVVTANGLSAPVQVYQIASAQPGIFLAGGGGAILDSVSQLVTAQNPAERGEVLQIFATGLGETNPPGQTGNGAPSSSDVLLPVTVTVGGVNAPVQYQGLAPGFVGLYQVNVQLPTTVTPGDAVEVVILQNGIPSNPDRPATIPVQ